MAGAAVPSAAVAGGPASPDRAVAQNAAPAPGRPAPSGGAPPTAATGSELARITAAAEAGNEVAQYTLGMRFWLGDGVSRDVNKALIWLSRSAAADYAYADTALGMIYDDGDGVTQDFGQAAYHYRRAAEKKEPLAEYRLGLLYTHGRGVQQDYAEAARWYKAAAEQGWADAQNNLGYFYEFGAGVLKDPQAALAWYEKAAAGGNEEAKENLAHLKARLATANPAAAAPTPSAPGTTGAEAAGGGAASGAAGQSAAGLGGPQLSTPKPQPLAPAVAAAAGAGKEAAGAGNAIMTALTAHAVDDGDLPQGFGAPRAEKVPLGANAGPLLGEVRVELAHAAGPHWYGYRVYAANAEAKSAYNNAATDALLAAPAGFAVRTFTIRRFEVARLLTFQCLHGHDPNRAPESHEVTCMFLEPDAPLIVVAGAAARYQDAGHPPEEVWQRLSDLLAYARGHWQRVRKGVLGQ
jgi:TPR repeat protein